MKKNSLWIGLGVGVMYVFDPDSACARIMATQ